MDIAFWSFITKFVRVLCVLTAGLTLVFARISVSLLQSTVGSLYMWISLSIMLTSPRLLLLFVRLLLAILVGVALSGIAEAITMSLSWINLVWTSLFIIITMEVEYGT